MLPRTPLKNALMAGSIVAACLTFVVGIGGAVTSFANHAVATAYRVPATPQIITVDDRNVTATLTGKATTVEVEHAWTMEAKGPLGMSWSQWNPAKEIRVTRRSDGTIQISPDAPFYVIAVSIQTTKHRSPVWFAVPFTTLDPGRRVVIEGDRSAIGELGQAVEVTVLYRQRTG